MYSNFLVHTDFALQIIDIEIEMIDMLFAHLLMMTSLVSGGMIREIGNEIIIETETGSVIMIVENRDDRTDIAKGPQVLDLDGRRPSETMKRRWQLRLSM